MDGLRTHRPSTGRPASLADEADIWEGVRVLPEKQRRAVTLSTAPISCTARSPTRWAPPRRPRAATSSKAFDDSEMTRDMTTLTDQRATTIHERVDALALDDLGDQLGSRGLANRSRTCSTAAASAR
jgi:hypothetical protein